MRFRAILWEIDGTWLPEIRKREFPEMPSSVLLWGLEALQLEYQVGGFPLSGEHSWLNWDLHRTAGAAVSSWDVWGGGIPWGNDKDADPQTASCSLEMSLVLAWAVVATGGQHKVRVVQGLLVWFTVGSGFWRAGCSCGLHWEASNFPMTLRGVAFYKGTVSCGAYECRLWLACIWNPAVSFIGCNFSASLSFLCLSFSVGLTRKLSEINTNYVNVSDIYGYKAYYPKMKTLSLLMILQLKHCPMGNAFSPWISKA